MRLVKCILNLVIFGSNSFKYVDIPSFAFFFWVMGKAFNLCIVSGSEKVFEFILFRGMGICDLGELSCIESVT